MTENTAKDLILDIIGRLRSRKARPDFENICHMASRKHGLSLKETEEMMSKLVQENIVIRVTYKGRTSYRNAAKCSKTRMHAELLNKKAATKLRFAIQSRCSLNNNNNNSISKCEKHRGVNNNNNNNNNNNSNSNNNNNCTNSTCDNNSVNDCVHSSNATTTNQSGAGSCDSKTCSHSAQKSRSNYQDPSVATITNNNNNNNNNCTTPQVLTDECNGGGDDDSGNGDYDDSGDVGVSREQIELWWHAQGFESALAKIDLSTVIQNELIAKNIQLLPNGKLVLTNSGSTTTAANSALLNTASLSSLVPFSSDSLPTTNSSSFVPCSTPDTSSVSLSCQAPLSHAAVTAAATDTSPSDKQKADQDRNGICGSGGTGDTSRHPVSKNCLPKPPCKRGRPVSRRKKFLKTHGPDFQAEMPVAIHGITKCDFCQRPPDMNCGNQEEELLCCKDCNTKAHPSCMNYTPELALRVHQSPWQCPTCKVCSICKDPGNPAMLVCYSCDKGFHVQCLYPPLDKSPSGELAIAGHWVCSMCSKQDIKDNDSSKLVSSSEELMTIKKEACTYGPPTPSESPEPNLTEMQQDFPRKRNLYEGPYPDVTDYTIEDVVKFFKSKGFTKEASAFSEQEIDGKSLLLMKRDDVLVGLRDYICLGPALKIFKHVERLQWASE